MLSLAAVAKEPCSISMLTSIASLVDNITADQLGGINTVLKVWKVCRTLTPANPSEAHPMMERPATQSVSEHGDPGCGHRWSGRGPRNGEGIKLKTECIHAAHLRQTDPIQGA